MSPNDEPIADDAFAPDDAAGLSDAELRALLAQARATNDEPLRRLLASYVTLRRLAADAVTLVQSQYGGAIVARAPLLTRLKQLSERSAT